MAIYLQETSTIEGGGKQAFLEGVAKSWAPYAERSRGMRLVFLGSTIGSTALWPETTTLWELRDWQHYAETVDRMYTDDAQDEQLAAYWRASFQHRRLAQTRVLRAAPFSPKLDDLLERGVCGTTLGFESFKVAPGRIDDVLHALEERARIDAPNGRILLAACEVAFTNDAAAAIWVYRGLDECNAYQKLVPSNDALVAWRRSIGDSLVGAWEYWAFSTLESALWPKTHAPGAKVW
jgi:hypothetical protein